MKRVLVDTRVSVCWTKLGQKVPLHKDCFEYIQKWQLALRL